MSANADRIAVFDRFVSAGFSPSSTPSCDDRCIDLLHARGSLDQSISPPAVKQLNDELATLVLSVPTVMPQLAPAYHLPKETPSGRAGLWIGTDPLIQRFFSFPVPTHVDDSQSTFKISDWGTVYRGAPLAAISTSDESNSTPAPADGFEGWDGVHGVWQGPDVCGPGQPEPTKPSVAGVDLTWYTNQAHGHAVSDCYQGGQVPFTTITYTTVAYFPIVWSAPELTAGGALEINTPQWADPLDYRNMTFADFRARIMDQLLNDADLYPLLRLWLDHFLGGPSPDPTAGPPSDDDLLSYYTPELHYDSAEGYFADSPQELTDACGMAPGDAPIPYDNDLVSAYDGMIADACGQLGGDTFTLNLSTLGQHYPRAGGNEPTADDRLEESHTDQDSYARIYQDIVAHHPDFLNKTYGHAVRDAGGQLWLQYWFFEYYNSFEFLGWGLHEGDWEGIQVRLDDRNRPAEVVYFQHKHASACTSGQFELTPDGKPIVYVALGSHASYPHVGSYDVGSPLVLKDDQARGDGWVAQPQEISLDDAANSEWAQWPGHWGGTTAGNEAEQESPNGPGQHDQWDGPGAFATDAEQNGCDNNRTGAASASAFASGAVAHAAHAGRARAVRLTSARIRHGRASIGYRLARLRRGAKRRIVLLVSLHPVGNARARAWRRVVVHRRRGTLRVPGVRPARKRWVASVTAIAPDGELSVAATRRVRR